MPAFRTPRPRRSTRTRLAALSVMASVVALLSSATSLTDAGAAPTPARAATATGVSMAVEQAISGLGNSAYPDLFGDIEIINNHSQIAVYLKSSTPAIRAAFQALAPAGMLVFRPTPRSHRDLDAIHQGMQSRWASLRSQGINLVEFGPNAGLGKEDVGIENLTAAQAHVLEGMFGQGALNIYNVSAAEVKSRQLDTTRIDDTAPYNGGDAIEHVTSTSKSGCTSGFGIRISGNRRLLTAGHCFNVGAHIINERCTSFTDCSGSGADMGDVTQDGLGDNRCNCNGQDLDSAVFTGCNGNGTCGGSDLIFTGALGNPQIAVVSGIGSWSVGDQICESGAYGGEVCGFVVKQVNYCDTIGEYYLCHLTRTYNANDNAVSGDSGAPVFRFSGSSLYAVGTHTGHDTSHHEWFTGINRILDVFNATLITG